MVFGQSAGRRLTMTTTAIRSLVEGATGSGSRASVSTALLAPPDCL